MVVTACRDLSRSCLHHAPAILSDRTPRSHFLTPHLPSLDSSRVHLQQLPFPLLEPSIHLHICFLLSPPVCLGRLEHINRWHRRGLAPALNATLRGLKREARIIVNEVSPKLRTSPDYHQLHLIMPSGASAGQMLRCLRRRHQAIHPDINLSFQLYADWA